MAVRLRPQSSAWMAPHALAAQLTAQTGQIAASGPQALLAGLSQGVGAFTQKREQRRAEAINESRYQDSLRMRQSDDARQDLAFQYGVARDQAAMNKDFKTGAELAYALDPTPENLRKVQQADSNEKALMAALAKYGGVQLPEMPKAPSGVPSPSPQGAVAPTAGTEPMSAGSYNREDAKRLAISMRDMSDEELSFVSEQYAQEAMSRKEILDKAGKAGVGPSRTKSEYDEYSLLARIAQNERERRKVKSKPDEIRAEAAARAEGELSVKAPAKAADEERQAAKEKAELDAINEARKAEGLKPIASLRQVSPQMTRERMDAGREDTQQHQKDMAAIKDANARGRMLESEGIKKRLIDYAAANGKADDPRFKMLNVLHDNATEEAYRYYSAAGNDTLPKAAVDALMKQGDAEMNRAKEITKQMAMVFEGAASPKTVAPAPAPAAGGVDAKASAATEFGALPKEQQTQESWAKIKAKYGIK